MQFPCRPTRCPRWCRARPGWVAVTGPPAAAAATSAAAGWYWRTATCTRPATSTRAACVPLEVRFGVYFKSHHGHSHQGSLQVKLNWMQLGFFAHPLSLSKLLVQSPLSLHDRDRPSGRKCIIIITSIRVILHLGQLWKSVQQQE